MSRTTRLSRSDRLSRKLRLERLEDRALMSAEPLAASAFAEVAPPPPLNWEGSALCDANGVLWAINTETGVQTVRRLGSMGVVMSDIAYHPANGKLYGVTYNSFAGTAQMYEITVTQYYPHDTLQRITSTPLFTVRSGGSPLDLRGLEFDENGTLFAAGENLATGKNWVYTIDLATQAVTPIVQLRIGAQDYEVGGDIEFDPGMWMYVSTLSGEVLLLEPPGYTRIRVFANTSHGDFNGLIETATYPALYGFGPKDTMGQNEIYQINPVVGGAYKTGTLVYPSGTPLPPATVYGAASMYMPQLADLRGAGFVVRPSTSVPGGTVTVSYAVQNLRLTPASGFTVNFYLSRDARFYNSDDLLLGKAKLSGMAGNTKSGALRMTFTLPAASHAFWQGTGTYYLGMFVDSARSVVESDERNNFGTRLGRDYAALTVTVPSPAPAPAAPVSSEATSLLAAYAWAPPPLAIPPAPSRRAEAIDLLMQIGEPGA